MTFSAIEDDLADRERERERERAQTEGGGVGQRLAFVSNGWAEINARYICDEDSISLE